VESILPFTVVTSRVVPYVVANVDTDQIIPAQHVNAQGRDALARALFANCRAEDPDFVLDRPAMRGRTILLAGPNFGCGSSREAAAWALAAHGFRAVVAPSFNDTFWSNCTKNGLLPLAVAPDVHERIRAAVAADLDVPMTIDLAGGRADVAGITFTPDLEPFARDLLVRGIDELTYLLDRMDALRDYEARNGHRLAAEDA